MIGFFIALVAVAVTLGLFFYIKKKNTREPVKPVVPDNKDKREENVLVPEDIENYHLVRVYWAKSGNVGLKDIILKLEGTSFILDEDECMKGKPSSLYIKKGATTFSISGLKNIKDRGYNFASMSIFSTTADEDDAIATYFEGVIGEFNQDIERVNLIEPIHGNPEQNILNVVFYFTKEAPRSHVIDYGYDGYDS